jgi:hypothetical protein
MFALAFTAVLTRADRCAAACGQATFGFTRTGFWALANTYSRDLAVVMSFAETEKPTNRCSDSAKQPRLFAVFALRTIRSDCDPDACPGPGTCPRSSARPGPGTCASANAALACADTSACTWPRADSVRTGTCAGANAGTNAALACADTSACTCARADSARTSTCASANACTRTAGAYPGPYSRAGAAATAFCKQLKAWKN